MPVEPSQHSVDRLSPDQTPPRRLVQLYGRLMIAAIGLFLIGLVLVVQWIYRGERQRTLEALQGQFDERVERVADAARSIEAYIGQFADQADSYLAGGWRLDRPADALDQLEPIPDTRGFEFVDPGWTPDGEPGGNLITTRRPDELEGDPGHLPGLAIRLQPYQRAIHRDLGHVTLSYFFSLQKDLLGIYPYVPASEFLRSAGSNSLPSALAYAWKPYEEAVREDGRSPEPFWTVPYEDRAGHGMMVSRVEPVFSESGLVGLVGADVTLALLQEFIEPLDGPAGVLVLATNAGQVLAGARETDLSPEEVEGLRALILPVLDLYPGAVTPMSLLQNGDFRVLMEGVSGAPWTVAYAVRHRDLSAYMIRERLALIVLVAGVAAFLIGGFFLVSRTFIRPALRAEESLLDSLQKEAELAALRSQINPHFLFNSLNTVRALIRIDPEQGRYAVTRLSKILRVALEVGTRPVIALADELEVVESYLALEKIRFEERLSVEMEVAEGLEQASVPPMMIQTLVENAVKHGVEAQNVPGPIGVRIWAEGASLVVRVTNPGTIQAESRSTRVGLRNARERLVLLFGDQASLTLDQGSGNVVRAEARFPIIPVQQR